MVRFWWGAQDNKLTDGRRMAAGFAAGITEALIIVTPFEVVKIRLQQQHGQDKALLKYKVMPYPTLKYKVMPRCS